MDNMDSFEKLGFELTGPGSKKKPGRLHGTKGGGRDGGSVISGGGSSSPVSKSGMRLPNLSQTYRKYIPPPSVVLPNPGKRDISEARISHSRIQKALESWEERSKEQMIGANPFAIVGNDREHNLEGLVIDISEVKNNSSTGGGGGSGSGDGGYGDISTVGADE